MDAVERAVEMMHIPQCDLPPIALKFARYLCSKYGMCGEVYVTAYAVYAQLVEKLPCTDDLYIADKEAIEWFKENAE